LFDGWGAAVDGGRRAKVRRRGTIDRRLWRSRTVTNQASEGLPQLLGGGWRHSGGPIAPCHSALNPVPDTAAGPRGTVSGIVGQRTRCEDTAGDKPVTLWSRVATACGTGPVADPELR
jgi:hypothetical protein